MRSPDGPRRATAALLVLAAVLFAGLAAWSLAARSAIPLAIEGTVTDIEIRHEKHPGEDDVWLVSVDGEQHHLGSGLAKALSVGDRLSKDRWETRLEVNGEGMALQLSDDAFAMLFFAPILALTAAVVALPGRRRGPHRS